MVSGHFIDNSPTTDRSCWVQCFSIRLCSHSTKYTRKSTVNTVIHVRYSVIRLSWKWNYSASYHFLLCTKWFFFVPLIYSADPSRFVTVNYTDPTWYDDFSHYQLQSMTVLSDTKQAEWEYLCIHMPCCW